MPSGWFDTMSVNRVYAVAQTAERYAASIRKRVATGEVTPLATIIQKGLDHA